MNNFEQFLNESVNNSSSKQDLEYLPKNEIINSLVLRNVNVTELPEGLKIKKLDLTGSSVEKVGKIEVLDEFDLYANDSLKDISNIAFGRRCDIILDFSSVEKLPDVLNVRTFSARKMTHLTSVGQITAKKIVLGKDVEIIKGRIIADELDISESSIDIIPKGSKIKTLKVDIFFSDTKGDLEKKGVEVDEIIYPK